MSAGICPFCEFNALSMKFHLMIHHGLTIEEAIKVELGNIVVKLVVVEKEWFTERSS